MRDNYSRLYDLDPKFDSQHDYYRTGHMYAEFGAQPERIHCDQDPVDNYSMYPMPRNQYPDQHGGMVVSLSNWGDGFDRNLAQTTDATYWNSGRLTVQPSLIQPQNTLLTPSPDDTPPMLYLRMPELSPFPYQSPDMHEARVLLLPSEAQALYHDSKWGELHPSTRDAVLSILESKGYKEHKIPAEEISKLMYITERPKVASGRGSKVHLKEYRCLLCSNLGTDKKHKAMEHMLNHFRVKPFACINPKW
ncbi:hypothetical protein FRC17_001829 [Serendipita sp. 399]|nr:hypothetical protein FRC17_001829 [Serendipita sp. 399]